MVPAMGARIAYLTALFAAAVLLEACGGGGSIQSESRAAWRGKTEAACLVDGRVRASSYVHSVSPINGPSACGLQTPLKVSGAYGGRVRITPTATLGCPLTASLDRWIKNSVQKAAYRQFRQHVVEIKQISSYSCRGRNGRRSGPLSEHSFGNALDVAAFRLSDGRVITVLNGWSRGTAREQAFLREAFVGACNEFYTVLGPGADRHHANHFHMDLLVTNVRKSGRHFCQPRPRRGLFAAIEADPQTTASIGPIPFVGPGSHH
jgi:hypothetical protein